MSAMFAALLVLVPAPPAVDESLGAPPTLQFVKWNNGKLEQTVIVIKQVPVVKEVTENVNGQIVTKQIAELVTVSEKFKRAIEAGDAQVYDLDGEKVEEAVWQKALEKGAIVLVAGDGLLPHSAFRKAIKDGTLVVVLKLQPKTPEAPPK